MDQQKREKFRIIHKRLFVGLVAVLIVVIIVSSVISIAFLYVPPYTLHNSSREFTFTTNNSEFKGVVPLPGVGYYYVNGNLTSTTYLNQSKPSTFEITASNPSLHYKPNIGIYLRNSKQGALFYYFGLKVSVRGHILDNLHPTGIQFHFYLLSNGGKNSSTYIINRNDTCGFTCGISVNNLSSPVYSSSCCFPFVLDLSTKNITHFNFFSDKYYNFSLTMYSLFAFNTTSSINSVQGQNFELCASLLGLGKKVTASIEVKIGVSPLVYITEERGYIPFDLENDVTKAVYAVNNTSRTLTMEPYTTYTAFFYLNGTKEQYTFNSGPPFQARILNAFTSKPYFELFSY